jgi:ABC-type glycerol-3-phosphate transport system substrate-binding protein
MTITTLSRRSFGKLATAFAVLAPTLSFGQQQVELSVIAAPNFSPGATNPAVADAYKAAWAKFEAENPDVRLKLEPHAGNTEALQEILTKASSGRLADVGVMDTFWIPRLHAGGYLQPMDDVLSAEAKADYLPGVIEATTHDGALRSLYIYNSWRGIFYRPSEVKALGYDAPPTDWDEFVEFGKKAVASGKKSAVMFPANMSELTMLYMFPQILGLGAEIHDATGKPNFFESPNREKLEQVMQMWRDLVADGLMPVDVGGMDETAERPFFYSGETLTIGSSSSFINQLYADVPDIKGDLGASKLPLPGGATPVPLLAAWGYTIHTTDPVKADAAKRFVRFMLDPAQLAPLNALQGHLPIRRSIWESTPAFSDDPLFQQLYEIQNDPRLRERSIFPIYPAIKDAITGQMAEVIAGRITPAQAVDNAKVAAMEAYARLGG